MPENAQGLEKYEPNRIEWLALQLNSNFQYSERSPDNFNLYYMPGTGGNTIRVILLYYPGMTKDMRDKWLDLGKKAISTCAESYGWDSWVEVEVEELELK